MESAQAPSLRRLNGRLQACEPCRLRKVACDHTQPICKRCRKRRQEKDCVYVVTNPKPGRARLQHQPTPSRTPTPRQAIPTVVAPGYFGFTSHSTVFEETRNSLSLVHGPELGPSHVVNPIEIPLTLDQPLRAKSLWVLKNLPILKDWDVPPRASTCYPDVWTHRAVVSIFQTLKDTFEEYLGHGDDKLEEMVQILCENTAKPFLDESDAQLWLGQFTGPNLRWESLGLIWTFWELGPGPTERTGPTGLPGPPRAISPNHVTTACLGYCIDLARCFSQGNDLLLWLHYRKCTMDSIVLGDASLACWSSHGASISLLTFLGRHVEPSTPYYKPTLCSENKRRFFALCFNLDKVLVAFTGRPPLLNGRYCTTPLPLDLSDEDLLADEETLTRAVESLNENGWNTRGKVYRSTLLRARVMCSYILDEILEFALNPRAKPSVDDLLRLKTRQLDTVATFPKSIMYDPQDIDDPDVDVDVFYARLLTQLKHLQNLFFIERLMLRLGKPNEGDLLVTSFEMVSLTLIFWTHKDLFGGIIRDFEWLLMAYAAPGGGILCLELLRPTFSGFHPKNPRLSRSSIVQQLSLLIGFLEWVKPSAPNGDLCQDCKAIIQKVLDHFLNTTIDGGGALETLDWNFPTQLDFNFDLLDTFDWLRAD